jgi:Tfp pilus assembly protein PilX
MRRLLNRFLRRQDGIALPVVIGSLTVVSALAVGTFAVSVENHHASARDRDSKRALAAAEAGLQTAILRITDLEPDPGECVTDAVVLPGTGGAAANECPSTGNIALGNGATFRYTVSTATAAQATCATIPGFTPTVGEDRCITAIGTANGVSRRLQLRFYFQPPFLPWGNAGLVGKDKVDIGNNKVIESAIGTNGQIILGNNSSAWEFLIPGTAPDPERGNNSTVDTEEDPQNGSAIRLPRVSEWAFPDMDWDTPRNSYRVSSSATLESIAPAAWDGKYLKLAQQQDITLPGGNYYMCGFDAPNGNTITVPVGQFVRLYVDSAAGNPSWCNDNDPIDGQFNIKNDGSVNPLPTNKPTATQFALFLYGSDPEDDGNYPLDIDINNGVSFWGTIWAPYSQVSIKNNQTVKGGITAAHIDMKNNGGFVYDSDIENQSLPGTAESNNLSWNECARDPAVATDPESGCS